MCNKTSILVIVNQIFFLILFLKLTWQQQNIDTNTLETKSKIQQKFIFPRRVIIYPAKKLNEMKVHMAQLEWYKKKTKNQRIDTMTATRI